MSEKIAELTKRLHKAQYAHNTKEELRSLLLLASAYYSESNYTKTKRLLLDIKRKDAKYPNLHYLFALLALQERKTTKALDHLQKELKLNPRHEDAKRLAKKLDIYSRLPLVTLTLFALNTLVFFFTFPQLSITQLLTFSVNKEFFGFFQLVSSLFFHANTYHYLFNMVALLSFGIFLEKFIGPLKFAALFFVSGILGNLFEVLLLSQNGFVIGASAALFGLIGATLMREPLLQMRILGFIKVPLILVLGLTILLSLFLSTFNDGSLLRFGEIAHLSGLYLGILFSAIFYRETISVFYYWIFISFGFLLAGVSLREIIAGSFWLDPAFLIIEIVLGIFLIIYSYTILRQVYEVRGEKG